MRHHPHACAVCQAENAQELTLVAREILLAALARAELAKVLCGLNTGCSLRDTVHELEIWHGRV